MEGSIDNNITYRQRLYKELKVVNEILTFKKMSSNLSCSVDPVTLKIGQAIVMEIKKTYK